MKNKAFTLIELLVVVAIISILATIILVGVRDARLRAKDSKIQSALFELRNAAEMSFVSEGNYRSVCDETDNTLTNSGDFEKIEKVILKYNDSQNVTCIEAQDKGSYAVSSPLVGRKGKHWCVCSVGIVREIEHPTINSFCD